MSTIKTWKENAAAHLPDLRETIDKIPFADVRASYMVAEIAELRAALAASGGNAAPELPEPTIDGTVYHEQLKICYTAPVHYTADQMTAYGKACAAASAPNAALVAALRNFVDGCSTSVDAFAVARAALSAAGQEVK